MEEHCLGLEFLGACSYTAKGPLWSFLSIGDVIGVISFLVVFTQLVSVVKREKIPRIGAQRLSLLGTAFIFIPLLLQIIPGPPLPVLGYPVFWEFLSAGTFLIVICWLVQRYHASLSFSPSKSDESVGIATRVIAKGEESDYVELAEALTPAIPEIVEAVKQFQIVQTDMRRAAGAKHGKHALLGLEMIRVLADELFCKAIVRKEPGFLILLFQQFEKKRIHTLWARQLVWQIVNQSLENPDSVLQRERAYAGLGLSKSVTNAIFSSYDLIEDCLPLSNWRPRDSEKINFPAYEAYCECFSLVLRSYLKSQRFYEASFALNDGRKILEHLSGPIYRLNNTSEIDINESDGLKMLRIACSSLEDALKDILDVPELNDAAFIDFSEAQKGYYDYSILGMYADWVYQAIEAAAHVRKHELSVRFPLATLWHAIYSRHEEPSMALRLIRKKLELKIFEKLKDNFEQGLYPAISRVLISIFGFNFPRTYDQDYLIRIRFYCYLQSRFLSLYQMSQERALDKLPEGVTFDLQAMVLMKKKRFWAETDQTINVWEMDFYKSSKRYRCPFI